MARNKETIPRKPEAHIATKRKIWYQIRIYIKAGWSRWRSQIQEGTLSKDEVEYRFHEAFGQNC